MNGPSSSALGRALGVSLVILLGVVQPATAGKVYVSNNGVDGGSCGAKKTPCRSITQGIANAAIGDKVSVGPGRYGDLDGDGTLGEPGEETAGACDTGTCVLVIDKEVEVLSETGAFSTVVDPGPGGDDATVALAANGVVFGGKNKGFTILTTPAFGFGAFILPGIGGTTFEGNVVQSSDGSFGMIVSGSGGDEIVGNRFLLEPFSVGIWANGVGDNEVISGNTFTGGSQGVVLTDSAGHQLSSNVFAGNEYGLLAGNVTNLSVTKSLFHGNTIAGFYVTAGTTGSVTTSSFVGNGTDGSNCGFDADGTTVTASGNWWGAASGPGVDPADDACNEIAGATDGFATKPIKVKPKPLR